MEWRPILSSILRNKVGAILIALQVAVTLAVLCNAIFIISQRTAASRAPSGLGDEGNTFVIDNRWVDQGTDFAAREKADLTWLRSLPQIVDATASIDHPLGGPLMGEMITAHPDKPASGAVSAIYLADDHAINTFELRLAAGRNFTATDVVDRHTVAEHAAALGGIVVTRALADKLFPDGKALGQTVWIIPDHTSAPIVGVLDRLQSSPRAPPQFVGNSVLVPYLWAGPQVFYIVRARRGQLAAAMTAARSKLFQVSHDRVLMGMQTFTQIRLDSYRVDRALALILEVVCAILLGLTGFGIVGLTSYWVALRRRHIGIRRALGATRGAILRYFQTENLLIVGTGIILGIGLAVLANLEMLRSVALARLPWVYPLVGAVAVLLLGQAAVLWPALRATSIPPSMAARQI
jgi:putative ABC transport system permease protein